MKQVHQKLEYFLETGLEITGKALKPNGKIADKVTLTLMVKSADKAPIFQMGVTDSLGRYGFYGLDFIDSTQIFVQGMKKSGGKNRTPVKSWANFLTVATGDLKFAEFTPHLLRGFSSVRLGVNDGLIWSHV